MSTTITLPTKVYLEDLLRYDEFVECPDWKGLLIQQKENYSQFVFVEFRDDTNHSRIRDGCCLVWGRKFWEMDIARYTKIKKQSEMDRQENFKRKRNIQAIINGLRSMTGLEHKACEKIIHEQLNKGKSIISFGYLPNVILE